MDMSFLKPNKANVIGTILILVVNLVSGMISSPLSHMVGLGAPSNFAGGARGSWGSNGGQFDSSATPPNFDRSGADMASLQSGGSGFEMAMGRILMSAVNLVAFGILSYIAIAFVVSMSVKRAKTESQTASKH